MLLFGYYLEAQEFQFPHFITNGETLKILILVALAAMLVSLMKSLWAHGDPLCSAGSYAILTLRNNFKCIIRDMDSLAL